MYVYVHVCMFVCVCVCTCVCVPERMCVHVPKYIYVGECMHSSMNVCE